MFLLISLASGIWIIWHLNELNIYFFRSFMQTCRAAGSGAGYIVLHRSQGTCFLAWFFQWLWIFISFFICYLRTHTKQLKFNSIFPWMIFSNKIIQTHIPDNNQASRMLIFPKAKSSKIWGYNQSSNLKFLVTYNIH